MSDVAFPNRDTLLPQFRGALEFAAKQARRVITTYPDYTPMYSVGGRGSAKVNAGQIGAEVSSPASSGCFTSTREKRNGGTRRSATPGGSNHAAMTGRFTTLAFSSFPVICAGIT